MALCELSEIIEDESPDTAHGFLELAQDFILGSDREQEEDAESCVVRGRVYFSKVSKM
jgi:hypothetical protein